VRIAELEGGAGKPPSTPTNWSLPLSSGQKANVADASTTKTRKGRSDMVRELCPSPDAMRDIYAEHCGCGAMLPATGQALAHAYNHIERPPIRPVTTCTNLHRADCRCCGRTVTADEIAAEVCKPRDRQRAHERA
jgi:transposase